MRTIVALVTLSLCVTSGIRACGNQERATPTVQSSAPAKRPAATSNAAPVSNASANLSAAEFIETARHQTVMDGQRSAE